MFVRLLKDPEPTVRAEAARSLGVIRDQTAATSLSGVATDDSDPHVRKAAFQSLALIGGAVAAEALQTLLSVLRADREPPDIRAAAAEQLGHLGLSTPEVLAGLRAMLSGPAEVAFWSVHALGLLGDRDSLGVLRDLAQSDSRLLPPYGSIRDEAARAIESIEAQRAEQH